MACSIYGQELVEYAVNYPVNTATPIEGSLDWSIFDKKLDNSSNDDYYTNQLIAFKPTKSYQSKGNKQVQLITDFDDGWGNIYQHKTELTVEALVYTQPDLEVKFIPAQVYINSEFQTGVIYNDSRTKGLIHHLDYDMTSDGTFDYTDVLKDTTVSHTFSVKQHYTVTAKSTYWDGWEYQAKQVSKVLEIKNTPPVANYSFTDSGICVTKRIWQDQASDLDGLADITYRQFKLYMNTSGTYNLIDSKTLSAIGETYSFQFAIEGQYRISYYVKDSDNDYNEKIEDFDIIFQECTGQTPTGSCELKGTINLQTGWQLIAIPTINGYYDNLTGALVKDGTISNAENYIMSQLMYKLGLGTLSELAAYIPVCNAFRGGELSQNYVTGVTSVTSTHNFNLAYMDDSKLEFTAFWIKVLQPVPAIDWEYYKA